MTQNELAGLLSEQLSISKASARRLIRAFAPLLVEALCRGEKIKLPGLGTFSAHTRAARSGFDPRRRSITHIPARRSVRFSAWPGLRAALLEPAPAAAPPSPDRQEKPAAARPGAVAGWRALVNSDEVQRLLRLLDRDHNL
jgi:DNA-binding protein HU-beta